MAALTKSENDIRVLEQDMRTLEHMLFDGFEPKLQTLIDILERHGKLGLAAPPFGFDVAAHISKRLRKRDGHPLYQFTLPKYEKFVRLISEMDKRAARKAKQRKAAKLAGDVRSNLEPAEFVLKMGARYLGITVPKLKALRTRLRGAKGTRKNKGKPKAPANKP